MRGVRGWNLVAALVGEILRDPYSHLVAAGAGWSYVPAPEDVSFLNWLDATAQLHHQKGKVPPKPTVRPWTVGTVRRDVMPDPERAQRRSALMMRLGLGGVVEADDEPDGKPQSEGDDRHH